MDDTLTSGGERKRGGGRLVMAAVLIGYALLLVTLIHLLNYGVAWNQLGVLGLKPYFADMRGLTAASDSHRLGYDPLVKNPEDPWGRALNYPRVWLLPLTIFHVHQSDTVPLGIGLDVMFYLCVFLFVGRINVRQGWWWAALLCAPSTMLAVERGNNDLVIFCLLALALMLLRRPGARPWFSYFIIGFCAVLKLYPITAFMLVWRETPRRAVAVLAVAGLAFAVYLGATRNDLQAITAGTPQTIGLSYGSHGIFEAMGMLGASTGLRLFGPTATVLAVCALACVVRAWMPGPAPLRRAEADGLMVGGILYVVTFVVGSNYNYRLIMLLFAVPALLQLRESGNPFYHALSGTMLVSLVMGWYLSPFLEVLPFFTKEIANWIVFAGMLFLLLQFLPSRREWTEEIAKLGFGRRTPTNVQPEG